MMDYLYSESSESSTGDIALTLDNKFGQTERQNADRQRDRQGDSLFAEEQDICWLNLIVIC